MKRFTRNTLFFLLPIMLFLALPFWVLYNSNENFVGLKHVLEVDGEILYGYAYNQENYSSIKYNTIKKRQFDVIALGSSRVLQFRSQMFVSSFYNAGFTLNSISHFKAFIELLPQENYPKVLIIGLDQNFFNPNWDNLEQVINSRRWTQSFTKNPSYKVYLTVYSDLISNKYSLSDLEKSKASNVFGLDATLNGNGFRSDGSFCYEKVITNNLNLNPIDFNVVFKRDIDEILNNASTSYMGADSVSEKALISLEEFLSFCSSHGIKVVGFLPPFADQIYQLMTQRGNHNYLMSLPIELASVFRNTEHEFYDFSTANMANSRDEEMLDGFHGSEVTYAKMLAIMTEKGNILSSCVNKKSLNASLDHPMNRYMLFKMN